MGHGVKESWQQLELEDRDQMFQFKVKANL